MDYSKQIDLFKRYIVNGIIITPYIQSECNLDYIRENCNLDDISDIQIRQSPFEYTSHHLLETHLVVFYNNDICKCAWTKFIISMCT